MKFGLAMQHLPFSCFALLAMTGEGKEGCGRILFSIYFLHDVFIYSFQLFYSERPGASFCLALPETFSCKYWKTTNRTGIMNTPNMTPVSIPPTAPVPIERLPNAEPPVAQVSGNNPTMNANDVIKIGRSLN